MTRRYTDFANEVVMAQWWTCNDCRVTGHSTAREDLDRFLENHAGHDFDVWDYPVGIIL